MLHRHMQGMQHHWRQMHDQTCMMAPGSCPYGGAPPPRERPEGARSAGPASLLGSSARSAETPEARDHSPTHHSAPRCAGPPAHALPARLGGARPVRGQRRTRRGRGRSVRRRVRRCRLRRARRARPLLRHAARRARAELRVERARHRARRTGGARTLLARPATLASRSALRARRIARARGAPPPQPRPPALSRPELGAPVAAAARSLGRRLPSIRPARRASPRVDP
jgi:hypothetical protein